MISTSTSTVEKLGEPLVTEEGVEGVITTTNSLVTWHLSIRLDAMLEAEKLPARIANLDASLSEVKAEDLTHICKVG